MSTLCTAGVAIKEDSESIERFKGVSKTEAELIASEYKSSPKRKIKDSIKPLGRKKAKEVELPLLAAAEKKTDKKVTPASGQCHFPTCVSDRN